MYFCLILLFVIMVQSHERLLIPQTFFTFVLQCKEFSILTFSETVCIIDILITMAFMLSFVKTLTTTIDGFKLNSAKVRKFRCICNTNNEIPIGILIERKFLRYKNDYNYDNANGIYCNLYSMDPTGVEYMISLNQVMILAKENEMCAISIIL